jgi:transposase InsO family protein
MTPKQRDIQRKRRVIEYAEQSGNIRTDRGHDFQAFFHWHVADLGMEHVYIKPRTPQLNGKV